MQTKFFEFDEQKERLDVFLQKKVPEFSRSFIKNLIEKGQVLVDGKVVKAGFALKKGMKISVEFA